jgi:hypothetical protein
MKIIENIKNNLSPDCFSFFLFVGSPEEFLLASFSAMLTPQSCSPEGKA